MSQQDAAERGVTSGIRGNIKAGKGKQTDKRDKK